MLAWNIVATCRGRGDRDRTSSDLDFDDQLLRVTEWANKTLQADVGRCGRDDDFAATYDLVYSTALHGGRTADEQLYRRLRCCVSNHLDDAVAPVLERALGGVELTAVTRRVYTDYVRATDRLADACAYLDVLMRRRGRGAEPVRAMTRSLFRDMLLQRRGGDRPSTTDLMGRLQDAVVRSADLHLWAGHNCADAAFCGRTVLAEVADSAVAAGLGGALARQLRDRFLDEVDRRLRAFARSVDRTAPGGYAEAAARTIDAEAVVALRYGGPVVARAVAARAAVLLVAERRAFVVHSDEGLCRMMDTGRDVDAAAKVYALLARLPDAFGSQVVAKAVACCANRKLHDRVTDHRHHVDGNEDENDETDTGTVIVSMTVRTVDHTRFVSRVIWFRDAMGEYLRRAFADDAVVAHAVEHHVRRAFDCCDDAPRHVARHINDLLTVPKVPDVASLDQAFGLLWYLDDEALDAFELIYRSVAITLYVLFSLANNSSRFGNLVNSKNRER